MRRKRVNANLTKQTVLNVAEELFLKNGVSRTSLEMIARESGLTRGAVYWHFVDKAHLVHEMLDRIRIPLDELTRQLDTPADGDSLARLHDMCVQCLANFVKSERERRVMTILLHRCELTPELSEFERRKSLITREFVALIEGLFEGQKHRLQAGVTPQVASLQLHSLFCGTLAAILRDQETFQPLFDFELIFTLYFNSLVKDWGERGISESYSNAV